MNIKEAINYFSIYNPKGHWVESGIITAEETINMREERKYKKEALRRLRKLIRLTKNKHLDELYKYLGVDVNVFKKKTKNGIKTRNLYTIYIEYAFEDSVDNWDFYNKLHLTLDQYGV